MNAVKIPKSVTLPGGYKIAVRLVPVRVLRDRWNDPDLDAVWVHDEMTMYIRDNANLRDTVWFFKHEMLHAVWDWVDARYKA